MAGNTVETFFTALFMTLIIVVTIGTIFQLCFTWWYKDSYRQWYERKAADEKNPVQPQVQMVQQPGVQVMQQQPGAQVITQTQQVTY